MKHLTLTTKTRPRFAEETMCTKLKERLGHTAIDVESKCETKAKLMAEDE